MRPMTPAQKTRRSYPKNRRSHSRLRELRAHIRAEHPECPLPKSTGLAELERWHDWSHRKEAS